MGALANARRRNRSFVKLDHMPSPDHALTIPAGARVFEASDRTAEVNWSAAVDDPLPVLVTVRGIVSFGSAVPFSRIERIQRIGRRVKHAGFTVRAKLDTIYAKEV